MLGLLLSCLRKSGSLLHAEVLRCKIIRNISKRFVEQNGLKEIICIDL